MRHLSKCIFEKDEIIEKVEQQEQLMVATIVKKTARTFRKVAHLKLTMHTEFTSLFLKISIL